jgi:membrane protease YdiL (CAAX protease family)
MQEKSEKNLWSFWPLRFVVLFALTMALLIGVHFLQILLVRYRGPLPRDLMLAIGAIIAVALTVLVYRLLVRWTEQRHAGELGSSGAISFTLTGMAMGMLLFTSVFVSLVLFGAAAFQGAGATSALMAPLASAASAAVGEEVIFRGVTFRLFEQGFGTTIAILLSGGLFGLLHIANPGATAQSTIAIALEAGILLAAAYALTRSLWFPIGLHFGWNFTEGGIFGTSVSGGKITAGLIATHISGPNYLTGGLFGPEASLPAVIVCLAAALVMLVLAARRGKWKSARVRWRTGD